MGMTGVDKIGEIRRAYFEQERPIKEIVRTLSVSRSTVRKVIRGQQTEFKYARDVQPAPRLGGWVEALTEVLEAEAKLAKRERRSTQRLFEELRWRGYDGAHDSVHRFVKSWREERARVPAHAYVPMSFAPGEAYQFDWSHETITLQGLPLTVKAAHMKLSHSRMPFVRVYFRETQELVFDAHDKAFQFYGGVCRRGIYDNMKTAVEAIFRGPGAPVQRPLSANVLAPSDRTGGIHSRVGLGGSPGREPRRQSAGPDVSAQASGEEPGRAECVAGGPVRRLRQTDPASGVQGSNDLGGIRGRAREPDAASRPLRRVRREGGPGEHDLLGDGRSQSLQRRRARGRPDGPGALPCRARRGVVGR